MSVMKAQSRERWLLPLSGMLLVMGALLGLQYHTWRANDPALWQRGQAGQVLRSYRAEMEKQKTEIGDLRAKLTTYENEASTGGLRGVLNDELQKAKIGLGTVPVEGPGIDSPSSAIRFGMLARSSETAPTCCTIGTSCRCINQLGRVAPKRSPSTASASSPAPPSSAPVPSSR